MSNHIEGEININEEKLNKEQPTPPEQTKALETKADTERTDTKSDHDQNEFKLNKLAKYAQLPLYKIKSVFPFDLFPDVLTIYREKILITRREFFWQKREFPIIIPDIKTIKVNTGLYLARLDFEINGYEQNPRPLNNLIRSQADRARKIIMGLVLAKANGINLEEIEDNRELLDKILVLGE